MKFKAWLTIATILGIMVSAVGCSPPTPALEVASETEPTVDQETSTPAPALEAADLVNPGFEEGDAGGDPSGWVSSGDVSAILLEKNGYSGDIRLTHKSSDTYQVETSQTVTGLGNGWYTLSAWTRSSGGQIESYLALRCGGEEKRANIPYTTPGYRWIRLVVSNEVTDGRCTINLHSFGTPDSWASFDDIELVPGQAALSILGADISSLHKSEDKGGVYKYSDGTEADALQILKDNGLNYARLRVWVDPADSYHNKAEILTMASRLNSLGIKLLVDFQ